MGLDTGGVAARQVGGTQARGWGPAGAGPSAGDSVSWSGGPSCSEDSGLPVAGTVCSSARRR